MLHNPFSVAHWLVSWWGASGEVAEIKMFNKTEQSDPAPNANEKPEDCYCSALPKGSGLCLPCYTRWLAGRRVTDLLRLPSARSDHAI